ncbi:type II toxin-antitoxin system RelE/ParE family toxin [Asticcacaulis taihuensis]|uniref:type II toxin-antitoxin system RelE/ParE family toxin n=1 Tax=Asticcacaulis taihuensis TaxID=260084 RepID=UPI003F7B95C0
MDFILSDEARADLIDIQDYIAANSPRQAARVIDDIFSIFGKLAEMPLIGHVREDLTSRPVRFFSVHTYLIVYDAASRPLSIVRVLSGYRDVAALLE